MNERLKRINHLAMDLHGDSSAADDYSFGSLREHVDEVQGLKSSGNDHWKAETMDIIIHGYLMLDRHHVDPSAMDALMSRRLDRFEEKIRMAVREKKG